MPPRAHRPRRGGDRRKERCPSYKNERRFRRSESAVGRIWYVAQSSLSQSAHIPPVRAELRDLRPVAAEFLATAGAFGASTALAAPAALAQAPARTQAHRRASSHRAAVLVRGVKTGSRRRAAAASFPPGTGGRRRRRLRRWTRTASRPPSFRMTTPGIFFGDVQQGRRLSRAFNDYAMQIVKDHPGRFGLFATLPLPDTDGSLEGDRICPSMCSRPTASGLMTSYGDKWLGDPAFAPVLARAQPPQGGDLRASRLATVLHEPHVPTSRRSSPSSSRTPRARSSA